MARSKAKLKVAEIPETEQPGTQDLWDQPACLFQSTKISFLWGGRIQRNACNMLQGGKACGKSTWIRAIAAHVTGGPALPGEKSRKKTPGKVLYYVGEENLTGWVIPGLDAAGANLELVSCADRFSRGPETRLRMPQDADRLISRVKAVGAELVILDPLFTFLSGDVQLDKSDEDCHRYMDELDRVCMEADTTFLVTTNITKGDKGDALNCGRGRTVLRDRSRAVLYVSKATEGDYFGLAVAAVNCGAVAPTLAYRIEPHKSANRIAYMSESKLSADDLAGGEDSDLKRRQLEAAKKLIRSMLPTGRIDSRQIKQKAEDAMISTRTLQLAARELGVRAKPEGSRERTVSYWIAPERYAE